MQGREVDEALMQERERDIKQINQDLVLVKEMFQGDVMSVVEHLNDAKKCPRKGY